jgi:hypothetical protein
MAVPLPEWGVEHCLGGWTIAWVGVEHCPGGWTTAWVGVEHCLGGWATAWVAGPLPVLLPEWVYRTLVTLAEPRCVAH